MKFRKLSGVISLALLPVAANAQLYQDASNSTAVVVRDPARQASTEIDAVIYNPAGTAFLDDGWHFSLNGKVSRRSMVLGYDGYDVTNTARDILPSVQAAFKKGKWSFSASLANEGGYMNWNNGEAPLTSHSFNVSNNRAWSSVVGRYDELATVINDTYEHIGRTTSLTTKDFGISESDMLMSRVNCWGDLTNYTLRLGAARQFGNFSAYIGIRTNYVTEHTTLGIKRWVENGEGSISPSMYFSTIAEKTKSELKAVRNATESFFNEHGQTYNMDDYEEVVEDLNKILVECANHPDYYEMRDYPRMNGWGLTPVIGLDYKAGNFNFAVKYEFETKIHTNNGYESFHIPAVLSGGASWQIMDNLKVAVGGTFTHLKTNQQYGHTQSASLKSEYLTFVPNTNAVVNSEFTTKDDGTSTSFDVSASVSFSPFKRFLVSLGYTYASRGLLYKYCYPQSISGGGNIRADVLSGGFCYQVSDNVKLDFGLSKMLPHSANYYRGLNFEKFGDMQTTNVSLGVTVSL